MASAHDAHDEVCAACESTSLIPHTFRTTILRVANLCCVQEDLLIRSTLADIKGIDNVNVNVVGKYVIINHCPVACCAPTSMLMDKLNEKRLGVTIREVASGDEEVEALSWSNCYERLIDPDVVQLSLVFVLFVVGVGIEYQSGDSAHSTISIAIYLCAIILGLVPIAYESLKKLLVRGVTDIKLLMVIASIGSVVLDDFLDSALVVVLFLMSEVIERYVKQYVAKAVEQTGGGIPRTATLVEANRTVPTSSLEMGDVLLVKTGEIICTDGVVVEGAGAADESGLTGEPIAIEKTVNSTVMSGSILQSGYLHVRITVLPQDSSMQKINTGKLGRRMHSM
jgi:cation transport ATPase